MISSSIFKNVWLLLVVLLIIMGNSIPLFLLVFLALLVISAPLFREFQKHGDLDERQIQITHYSSHIAYFAFSSLLALVLFKEWNSENEPRILWFILLGIPMSVKFTIGIVQSYGSVPGFVGVFHLFFRGIIPKNELDERQNLIGNFSSHIAFYLYTAMTVFYIIFKFIAVKQHPGNLWYMLLVVPLLVKFYVSLFKSYGAARGARLVSFSIAGFLLLFILLSHGLSLAMLIEAAPFLGLIGVSFLSFRFPKIAGLIFVGLGIASLIFFRGWNRFDIYLRLLMYSLIPLPVLLSGFVLIFSKSNQRQKA